MMRAISCAVVLALLATGAKAGVEDFYPTGPLFPCSAYSVGAVDSARMPREERDKELARARAAGFSAIGPQYELDNDAGSDAARFGFEGAIRTVGVFRDPYRNEDIRIPPGELTAQIAEQVRAARSAGPVLYWNLRQEELRYNRAEEMQYLEAVTAAVRAADPDQRPIMMYEPGNRNAETLAFTGRFLDLVTMGVYVNYMGFMDSRIAVAVSVREEVEAAKRLGGARGPLLVLEMFADPPQSRFSQAPDFIRHDVFRGLAEGAKGLIVFSFRHRAKFEAYEAYRASYERLAPVICGEAPLGRAIISGARKRLDVDIRQGPLTQEVEFSSARRRAEAMIAVDFDNRAERFRMLVNSAPGVVAGRVLGDENARGEWEVVLRSSDAARSNGEEFTLPPLGVVVLRRR